MILKKIFVAVIVLLSTGVSLAQDGPAQPQLIPIDPDVRIGHLDNGLTYYIRHNNYPEGKANFHILMKNGSLQEDESQRGLAHMIEHIAFTSTEHFPEKSLDKFIESNGAYTNADTWFDHTNYLITNVPTARQSLVDSCVLVLKDWSNGIVPTDKAIEAERDVVHNEYRLRMTGDQRILNDGLPVIMPDSKYGVRIPIGLMSVIDGCKPDVLRDYVKKWYHTDNQALIIVGDIDVDHIEAKIKELFSGITLPENEAKVTLEPVPDTKDALYYFGHDKELQRDEFEISMKCDVTPAADKQSIGYLAQKFVDGAVCSMLGNRYEEKAQDSACPFLGAGCSYGKFLGCAKTKDAFNASFAPKPEKDLDAYAAVLTELKRAYDYGFTATEYARYQDTYLSALESAYINRNKMKNGEFTAQYISNFDTGEPIPSVEQEYMIMKQIVPMITVDMVNARTKELISLRDSNYVVLGLLQEKEGSTYPTYKEFIDAKTKVIDTPLQAYVDNVKQEPLIAETPKAGKVVKTSENKNLGYKEYKLSNGATVIIKKTDYKDNEILLTAVANGGKYSLPAVQPAKVDYLEDAAQSSGLGNFSFTELKKAIAGKNVSWGFGMSNYSHTFSGSTTPKDIETMMQITHLAFTKINKDEKNYENWRQIELSNVENLNKDPENAYSDSVNKVIYDGDKLCMFHTVEEVKALNYDDALAELKNLYGNAKDFTFIFVGNIDEETFLPLVNTYIASLPNNGKSYKNRDCSIFSGNTSLTFQKNMANPNSHDTQKWMSALLPAATPRNIMLGNLSGYMLFLNYYRILRLQLSATYTPGAHGDIDFNADGKVRYSIVSDNMLNPDKCAEALKYVKAGLDELATNPNEEDFKKAKETFANQIEIARKTNGYWMNTISNFKIKNIDIATGMPEIVASFTPADVKDYINNVILKSGTHAEILMNAVKE